MNTKMLLVSCLACCWLSRSNTSAQLPNPREAQDYALFFAVNTYEYMDDLQNPIKNAEDIATELGDNFGFQTEIVRNPSIDDIDDKLAEYERKFNDGTFDQKGQLFIYFSGHGIAIQGNGYFMTPSADPARPHRTAMEYDFYRSKIDDIACQHILVVIDACHSATFDPEFKSNMRSDNDRKYRRPGERDFDRVLDNHANYRSRVFWTSDGKGDETPDKSSFAHHLLEGLRSFQSTKGYLRSKELYALYLEYATPQPGGGSFGSDEYSSCFLFFRNSLVSIEDTKADYAAWQQARLANTIAAYRQYLRDYPNGNFIFSAQEYIIRLETEDPELLAWQQAKLTNTNEAYERFLANYPDSRYAEEARRRKSTTAPDDFVRIEGGTFLIGDQFEEGDSDEKVLDSVAISTFYLSPYEVTFAEYDLFCLATGRKKINDRGWGRDQRPVINVSWCDAVAYANWLSEQRGLLPVYSGDCDNIRANWEINGYRLPTEAEWEYAARQGGQKVRFSNGKNTANPEEINFHSGIAFKETYSLAGNYREKTVAVGQLNSPNNLGLHDMSGNVLEWCWDWYADDYYGNSMRDNPRGPHSGSSRVFRGGGWHSFPRQCRAADRNYVKPTHRVNDLGFRLARSLVR